MSTSAILIAASVLLIIMAFSFKPLRKAIGLLPVIIGVFACMSGIGVIIGVPLILVGGLLIFI